jgi:hypothetical protein
MTTAATNNSSEWVGHLFVTGWRDNFIITYANHADISKLQLLMHVVLLNNMHLYRLFAYGYTCSIIIIIVTIKFIIMNNEFMTAALHSCKLVVIIASKHELSQCITAIHFCRCYGYCCWHAGSAGNE